MPTVSLSHPVRAGLGALQQVNYSHQANEIALVNGEKSLNDLSPYASALALHAKNNNEYAKGTMVRAVQAELATQAMISAINEGIELLTEAIHLTTGEVNDLNPTDIKAHTNEVFQSLLAGYDDMINQVLWNDKQMLAGLAQPLQFQ